MVAAVTVRKSGKVELAYVGATPWHGLGQSLGAGEPIEKWLVEAGMDWKVQRAEVRFPTEKNAKSLVKWPEQHVLFRSDTKMPLGIVSDKYNIVQPKQVLEFFRELTEANGFTLETAGTLWEGKRYWALANIGASSVIRDKKDVVGGKLLLATSADGSKSTTAKFTTVSVVCENTLTMAMGEKGAGHREITLSHRSKFDDKVMKRELGVAREAFEHFTEVANLLAEKMIKPLDAEELTLRLLNPKLVSELQASRDVAAIREMTTKVEEARQAKGYQTIMQLFSGAGRGATISSRKGTAWGYLNAVTEYSDYHRAARTQDNRLNAAWFGAGNDIKETAAQLVRQLVKV